MRFLIVVFLLALSSPTFAADTVIRESVAVCDPNSPQHCTAPDSAGNVFNQAIASQAVTPSDSTTYTTPNHGIYMGKSAACDVALKLANDTAAVTFKNVQIGQLLPFSVKSIMSTNTTCTDIVFLQ